MEVLGRQDSILYGQVCVLATLHNEGPMSTVNLTTEEVAMFQLLEKGFAGVTCGVTLVKCWNKQTETTCTVLAVYKPGIEAGKFNVEPIAELIVDPDNYIQPDFYNTDGEGQPKEDENDD